MRLARCEFDNSLHRGARVKPRAYASRKVHMAKRSRTLQRAVAPQELFAVARPSPLSLAHVQKRDSTSELVVVWIARCNCAGLFVQLSDDEGRATASLHSHHKLVVARNRKPTLAVRVVAKPQE